MTDDLTDMCSTYCCVFTVCVCGQGIEDAQGNMDFKVAGTREGITSLQVYIRVHVRVHDHVQVYTYSH